MDLLTSLDPTAVCVTLLVVALSLLWCYVSVSGSRREQPNLSALYEQTTLRPSSGSAGQHRSPRASKAKGKGKQVEGSPKPSSQKATTTSESVRTTASTQQKPAETIGQSAPTTTKKGDQNAPAPKLTGKSKKKRQGAELTEGDGGVKTKPGAEETNEGEWKTQLSRGQLKALRKKQRKEKEKAEASKSSSSDTDSKVASSAPSTEGGGEGREKDTKETGKEEAGKSKDNAEERSSKGNGSSDGRGRRGKGTAVGNRQKTASADATKSTDSNKTGGVGKGEQDSSCSSEPPVTAAAVSVSVGDVEKALKEAARSTSSSPETEAQSARTEAAFSEVVASRHRKQKRQQKATTHDASAPPQQIPETTPQEQTQQEDKIDHDEEWVVIDEDSLT